MSDNIDKIDSKDEAVTAATDESNGAGEPATGSNETATESNGGADVESIEFSVEYDDADDTDAEATIAEAAAEAVAGAGAAAHQLQMRAAHTEGGHIALTGGEGQRAVPVLQKDEAFARHLDVQLLAHDAGLIDGGVVSVESAFRFQVACHRVRGDGRSAQEQSDGQHEGCQSAHGVSLHGCFLLTVVGLCR